LREFVAATRQNYPFAIDAFVVLPDHLHAIWQLPPDDHDFSTPKQERLSAVRVARHERGIWQRRAYAIGRISSFHRDVLAGLFPEDWAGDSDAGGDFGERR